MNESQLAHAINGIIAKYNKDPKSLSSSEISMLQTWMKDGGYNIGQKGVDGVMNTDVSVFLDGIIANDKTNFYGQNNQANAATNVVANDTQSYMDNIKKKKNEEDEDYKKASKSEQDLKDDIANKVADVTTIANTGLSTSRYIQAVRQIKKAEKARQELEGKQPKLGALTKNAQLQEALQQRGAEAQYGFGAQSLGAKGSLDLTAYANAIKAAQTMGGGQTGVTTGMQTQAYRDILGSNLQTAIANEKEKNEKVALHSSLIGQGVSEDADIRDKQYRDYINRLKRYDDKLGNLRIAEQTGHINRDKILGQIPTDAANLVQNYYRRKEQRGEIPIKGTKEREQYDKAQEDLKIQKADARQQRKLVARNEFLARQQARQKTRQALLSKFKLPYMAQPVIQNSAPQTPIYYNGMDLDEIHKSGDDFNYGAQAYG